MTQAVTARERGRPRARRALLIIVILLIPFALHAIWDQVEASLLARAVHDLAARGEPINLDAQRAALPTAEERRAARLYAAAANLALGIARDNPDGLMRRATAFIEGSLSLPNLTERLDEIEREVADGKPALDLLDLATPLTFSGFGDDAPQLSLNGGPLLDLNALNAIRADIASARGQGEMAATDVAESIRFQRTMPAVFYEQAASARTFESLRLLLMLNRLPATALMTLWQAYDAAPDHDHMEADLQKSRARLIGDFWPYSPDLTPWALRMKPPIRSGVAATMNFVALRPWITHQFRTMLPAFDEALAVAKLPWPGKLDAADALARKYSIDPDRKTLPHSRVSDAGMFHRYLAPANLEWNLPSAGRILARRRVALVALAIERYRRDHAEALPQHLDALVPAYLAAVPIDPFSGRRVIFSTDGTSYSVYSVDVDRKDDGGALYGAYTKRPDNVFDRGARDTGIRVPLTIAR